MNKQSLEICLAEYTDKELIEFHANVNALFMCCNEDFKLMPLLMRTTFYIQTRDTPICIEYMARVDKMLNIPEEYKYKKHSKTL